MRKFNAVFKEKQEESNKLHENMVLMGFKQIYGKLLENYNVSSVNDLDVANRTAFLSQVGALWDEENGLNEKGKIFLNDNCMFLTESSTPSQKKNYLKQKSAILLKESLRQYDLKYKFYDILDEMYNQIKGENISDVLTPKSIVSILEESFNEVLSDFLTNVNKELKSSVKQ